MPKPLLLSPCGSYDSLMAALSAGADEVYLGLSGFNARASAENFDSEKLREALKLCRIYGVKSNITVNTLVTDRETSEVCDMVYAALCEGADAFIVQDIGLAKRFKEEFPEIVLHASTQCACHSTEGAKMLSSLGFERVVLAREMNETDIRNVVNTGIETEVFLHGALCVCHSGMCLMSSCIGERSGNRGMCAQPCRLPYSMDNVKNAYPLSLKDLCLAGNIEKLTELGVTSLKIEGRMKSPEYVYGVTSIYRKLLDENRSATKDEMQYLYDLFSRSGFTDKYFTGAYRKDNRDMYGVRSDTDKARTNALDSEKNLPQRRIPIKADCFISEGCEPVLEFSCDRAKAKIKGDFVCPEAKSAPVTEQEIKASLSKLGNTCFELHEDDINLSLSGNVFLSKSMLNSLRRSAAEALEEKLLDRKSPCRNAVPTDKRAQNAVTETPEYHISCRTSASLCKISHYPNVSYVSLPLWEFDSLSEKDVKPVSEIGAKLCVRMPRVMFDGEYERAKALLSRAKELCAKYVVVSNVGQINLAKESGLSLFAGAGLNVYNSGSVRQLCELGFEIITLSPELTAPQMRDINKNGAKIAAFTEGRQERMVLESCIVRANSGCKAQSAQPCAVLHDRKGYDFPVYGERRLDEENINCRCIVYNSVENKLTEKKESEYKKAGIGIFTVTLQD